MATDETYILFELAGTAYAVPSTVVQRMEMVEQVTPVPNAAAYVDGIVFSRGRVVPALNLRKRFGFAVIPYDSKTRLIVVAHAERVVGLIVDSAREFLKIDTEAIQLPPDSLSNTSGRYLKGIATLKERMVLLLDVAEVLNEGETRTVVAGT